MINHISLIVGDIEKGKKFFKTALASLGYKLLAEHPTSAGFGQEDADGKRDFWIHEGEMAKTKSFSCLAFTARSKNEVDNFYKAAIEAGGKDNGAPGYRPQYHAGYYAAYVISPGGYNIEAVFDDPEKK